MMVMPTNKKTKLEQTCAFHENSPSMFLCDTCGKSLCYYCQRNRSMPFQCPECMPGYWEKKVKHDRKMIFMPVLAVIILLISLMSFAIYTLEKSNEYTYIYVENDDIIPILHEDTYNSAKNEIDLTYKIYVTNEGTVDSKDVYIEFFILKNGTVRQQTRSGTRDVGAEKTEIFQLDVTVPLEEYDVQLKIWENDLVVGDSQKRIRVTRNDVDDLTSFDFDNGYNEDKIAYEEGFYGPGGGNPVYGWILLMVILIPLILILAVVFYKVRSKMPPPPTMQHAGYMPPPPPPMYPYQR